MVKKLLATTIIVATGTVLMAQEIDNRRVTEQVAKELYKKESANYNNAVANAKSKGWLLEMKGRDNSFSKLVGTDIFGKPVYFRTYNNTISAATIGTSSLWTGGSTGLNLSGSSNSVKGKIAIWDGGTPLTTHVELTGRITWKDAQAQSIADHPTHTSGTMIASGVNPVAKGMAYGAQQLIAYNFTNHVSEILSEAGNLLVSNHSYGTIAGWYYNTSVSPARWEWYGDFGANEDYKFGYYDNTAALFDSTLIKNPNYLPIFAAGNPRNDNGPAVGQPYYRYNSSGSMTSAGNRPAGISNNDSYNTIATYANAKNILTVGAVSGLPYGYNKPSDVVMSSFSGWGPTDDGRIKPDIVADGVAVTSSISTSNTTYASYSGTSMATPSVTGSLYLLQEYYNQVHSGSFMWSSTLKGLVIHTADEAGSYDGPDYQFGWGLVNMKKASDVIKANNVSNHYILEQQLTSGTPYSFTVVATGKGKLSATIAWLDPAGTVQTDPAKYLNDVTPKLVNDLDLRITKGGTTYFPWKLDGTNPSLAATKADNNLDNIERVDVDSVVPGQVYTVTVSNKGTIQGNSGKQNFSLILSGGNLGSSAAFCASTGTSTTAGAKIDSVVFAGIANKNTSNAGYNDYTKYTASVEPLQTIPITVSTNTRDASSNTRFIKVYIDYNNDNSFDPVTELVASSVAIASGTGKLNASVTIPSTLTVGNYMLMRVIVMETSSASNITPCINTLVGETEDFRVKVVRPSTDVALLSILSPTSSSCTNNAQFVTISLRNSGTLDLSNVSLTAIVKAGATTIATLTGKIPALLTSSSSNSFTFPNTFNAIGGVTYTITAYSTLTSDPNKTNDTIVQTITIPVTTAPSGTAQACNSNYILNVTNPNSTSNYLWYSSADTTKVIGIGASTTVSSANSTFYVRTGINTSVGPLNKEQYSGGAYRSYPTNTVSWSNYTSTLPMVMNAVRLYSKYPGKVTVTVADVTVNGTSVTYNTIYGSADIDVYSTSATIQSGDGTANDVADSGAYFSTYLPLPAGSHSILISMDGAVSIFRNQSTTIPVPYPLGTSGIFQITGNNNTTSASSYYMFLYDMKLSSADCPSPLSSPIVAVTAQAPVVTQSGSTLTSTIPSGSTIQWYTNGGSAVSGATSATYTPTASGSYYTQATYTTGCQLVSNSVNVTVTAVVVANDSEIGLITSPNPATSLLNVYFNLNTKADVNVELISSGGQKAFSNNYSNFVGKFNKQFNVASLASDTYILKIQCGNKLYRRTILISK